MAQGIQGRTSRKGTENTLRLSQDKPGGRVDLAVRLCENPPLNRHGCSILLFASSRSLSPNNTIAGLMTIIQRSFSILPALFAVIAGVSDWRSRRIPNWLTVPGFLLGVATNSALRGWPGAKDSLRGAGLGLLLLLAFVAVKGIGMGDLKLVTALGAFLGPSNLITVLVLGMCVNGLMAAAMIIWKKRVRETARNLTRMMAAFLSLHLPGPDRTLQNPDCGESAVRRGYCGRRGALYVWVLAPEWLFPIRVYRRKSGAGRWKRADRACLDPGHLQRIRAYRKFTDRHGGFSFQFAERPLLASDGGRPAT